MRVEKEAEEIEADVDEGEQLNFLLVVVEVERRTVEERVTQDRDKEEEVEAIFFLSLILF